MEIILVSLIALVSVKIGVELALYFGEWQCHSSQI